MKIRKVIAFTKQEIIDEKILSAAPYWLSEGAANRTLLAKVVRLREQCLVELRK